VLHVNEVLTQHLGPSDILVNLSIDMADDLSAGEVESLVTRLDRALKQRSPDVTRVFIEIQQQGEHGVRAAA
jgi:divalent metal cation (Fe/Co/Zn/Cd) transporter